MTDVIRARLTPGATTGFDRTSVLRRVGGDPIIALALLRILTLDVAHPKVASGVRDHSDYTRVPFQRLAATLDAGVCLVWGDPELARATAARVHAIHDHINGHLGEPTPEWPASDRYTAHDATLQLWVWATLVDSIEATYTRWVRPFRGDEAERYYDDMRAFARFFGIPDAIVPPDRAAFAAYYAEYIDGDRLGNAEAAAGQLRSVLWFRHPGLPGPVNDLVGELVLRPLRVLALGTLDPGLLDRLGLTLNAADRALFGLLDGALKSTYRFVPPVFADVPYAYLKARKALGALVARRRPRPDIERTAAA